jgi:hypothetical protein
LILMDIQLPEVFRKRQIRRPNGPQMRHRQSQVGDAGFEFVHEAGNRAMVLAVIIGNDPGRVLACNGPARRLMGRLRADLELRPDVFRHLGRQVAHAMGQATLPGRSRKANLIALMMPERHPKSPAADSFRPRRFMFSKNTVTVSASSLQPVIMCSSTRRPSIVKPQAARTGSRLEPGRKTLGDAIDTQIRDLVLA